MGHTQGIAESFKKICGKYGTQAYFKGNITIKQLLLKSKDQDKKWGHLQLPILGHWCDEEYIGEISRIVVERCKEHLKQPSPIYVHSQLTGHTTTTNNLYITGREDQGLARTIKESIYIRVNNPTLNRNIGKYILNHIWDRVILKTPGLKMDSSQNPMHLKIMGISQPIQPMGIPK